MALSGSLTKLHIVVFLLGFTAVLGKLIHLSAIELVWYRMLFAVVALLIFLKYKKISLTLPRKTLLQILGTGLIVATHWILFFSAVKVSNVSVTLGCISVGTLFTGILEPIFNRRRASVLELVIGVIIIGAIYMIFQFETRYTLGIILSVVCALFASLFTVINRKFTATNNANVITYYEMLAGFTAISIYMFITGNTFYNLKISLPDFAYLLILGVVCTAYAFVVMVELMKKISAYTVVLSINLEPVYGIIFAFLIFGESEHMTTGFYAGTSVLLLCVFGYSFLKKRLAKNK